MSLQQLKKYIFYLLLSIGLLVLIYIGIKNSGTSIRELKDRERELQKLKEQLFDCDTVVKESTCTNEELDKIQEKIKDLENRQ